jgi:outer membrane protein assembly factor BamB
MQNEEIASQNEIPKPIVHDKRHLDLEWVANTPAVTNSGLLIYGSNTGETVWFDPSIGFIEHRYRIGPSVHVAPALVQGVRDEDGAFRTAIITPATDGTVIAVDANQVNQIWMLKLLDAVETPIACATNTELIHDELIPRTSIFISGSDQYLRSVDMHTGKPRWKVLCTSPLTDTSVIYRNALYQRIPNTGLVSYKAFPETSSGELIWVADDVFGNIITTN